MEMEVGRADHNELIQLTSVEKGDRERLANLEKIKGDRLTEKKHEKKVRAEETEEKKNRRKRGEKKQILVFPSLRDKSFCSPLSHESKLFSQENKIISHQ